MLLPRRYLFCSWTSLLLYTTQQFWLEPFQGWCRNGWHSRRPSTFRQTKRQANDRTLIGKAHINAMFGMQQKLIVVLTNVQSIIEPREMVHSVIQQQTQKHGDKIPTKQGSYLRNVMNVGPLKLQGSCTEAKKSAVVPHTFA